MKPEATATTATVDEYRALYGPETVVFGTTKGSAYYWYQSPCIVLTVQDDGSRTTYQTVQRDEPKPVTYGF